MSRLLALTPWLLMSFVHWWSNRFDALERPAFWATHDIHALPNEAERIVLLRDQRVLFDGPKAEGLSRPWVLRASLAVPQEDEPLC